MIQPYLVGMFHFSLHKARLKAKLFEKVNVNAITSYPSTVSTCMPLFFERRTYYIYQSVELLEYKTLD